MLFNEFISMTAVDAVLTEEVLNNLENLEVFKSSTLQVVGQLPSAEIALAYANAYPNQRRGATNIAIAVLNLLASAGYGKTNQPAFPTELTIKTERTLALMSVKELLVVISEDESQKREAFKILMAHPDVVKAQRRSTALAWVINSVLDINRTEKEILSMGDPLSVKQLPNREKKERLLTLGEAFGIETRAYKHPLTGQILRGPDQLGIDWPMELDSDSHKAALWALQTENPLHPKALNFEVADKLISGGDRTWSHLIAAYWTACDANDLDAKNIEIYVSDVGENVLGHVGDKPAVGKSQPDDEHYRQLLLELSNGDERIAGYDRVISQGTVYGHLHVAGFDFQLKNVVCMKGATVTGYNISGTLLIGPGQKYSDTGYDNNGLTAIRCKTWQEAARRAGIA